MSKEIPNLEDFEGFKRIYNVLEPVLKGRLSEKEIGALAGFVFVYSCGINEVRQFLLVLMGEAVSEAQKVNDEFKDVEKDKKLPN